ncbi:SDR family oxidoreductase [Pandoraea nosoerga]|uniref:Short-chain dehydrogenase n=1 Tax=Pandoraea nosoerga TaxID=2508296 RepID=A0A5E4VXM9_9BURK|nr:SDR family oxidoreductase [Pandoraea nosoerga]MBN4666216.1 SDR family oxidoreductase [Pandoraea nosoerga]MBN4676271.1 SDR family oxidoreductase [Pandoraea nosoerga]MBN4681308.1 SDR family oxidoreductase [Pandoraea nosoerga]MBN4745383.1 SDR family oxidoreductase [Pandoraea nosoerga]VVE16881.1 short-chain dehydrogenase [Pandoraea nosoerga]
MSQTIAILTGASRGLGAALARELLAPGTHLVTLARHPDDDLAAQAAARGASLEQIAVDLSDAEAAAGVAERIFAALPREAGRYLLINNAGTVNPVANAAALDDAAAIGAAFALNVTSVMLLTSRFLAATQGLAAKRQIVNISSGAGRNPNAGWAVYCSTKAALDMYTRVVNAEHRAHGVQAVSLAPGVVDTGMQETIRSSSPESFPALARFQEMKASGKLSSPEDVARRILALTARDDFGQTEIDDIRNYA